MITSAIGSTTDTTASDATSRVSHRRGGRHIGDGPASTNSLRGQTVDGLSLSDPAKLVQQLQAMGQQNPTQLKQTLSDIATKLRSIVQGATSGASATGAASSATSGSASSASAVTSFEAQRLSVLATKFDQAAQTGNLTSLTTPGSTSAAGTEGATPAGTPRAGHHHGHHHGSSGGAAAYAAADAGSSSDPLQSLFASTTSNTTPNSATGAAASSSASQQFAVLQRQIKGIMSASASQTGQTAADVSGL